MYLFDITHELLLMKSACEASNRFHKQLVRSYWCSPVKRGRMRPSCVVVDSSIVDIPSVRHRYYTAVNGTLKTQKSRNAWSSSSGKIWKVLVFRYGNSKRCTRCTLVHTQY